MPNLAASADELNASLASQLVRGGLPASNVSCKAPSCAPTALTARTNHKASSIATTEQELGESPQSDEKLEKVDTRKFTPAQRAEHRAIGTKTTVMVNLLTDLVCGVS